MIVIEHSFIILDFYHYITLIQLQKKYNNKILGEIFNDFLLLTDCVITET